MHPLSLLILCSLTSAQPAPTTQPATQPAYYISKYSTTYHQGDCAMLPADDRQVASPEDLRTRKPCKFCVREPVGEDGVASTTQPAIVGIAKYYNLIRNEFIKEEDGAIELTFPELQEAILRMRAAAAEERELLDQDIADLTREIGAAERRRREAAKNERDSKADARRHAAKENRYTYQFNSRSFQTRRYHNSFEEGQKEGAKRQAERHGQQADQARGDVAALRMELMELKRAAATLAAVASPLSRNLPPREFWKDLPPDQQEQLARVGITLDELKGLLTRLGQNEDVFLAAARQMEQGVRSTDELVKRLRGYFEQQLGPRQPPRQTPTARPAASPRAPAQQLPPRVRP